MSFKVTDKRHSSEEEEEKGKTDAQQSGTKINTDVDLSSFIISIATAAMVSLGEIPNPATGETEINLDIVKYNINLISLLKEKTKNNVTQEEENLIENVLYSLRMKFVEKKGL